MKTELQKQLATIAPSISISTAWNYDETSGPISQECDGFDESENDKWTAWQSRITAKTIIQGEEIEGNAYLHGIFEQEGDNPHESNPTISGCENQMTLEALHELPESDDRNKAIAFILAQP